MIYIATERRNNVNSERRNKVDNRFKFVNFTDRVKRKSKIQTNQSKLGAHVEHMTFNISNNQLRCR